MARLALIVNGQPRDVDVDPETTLLAVLRDELDLTGTKYGCGEGQCGACTVLVEGRPVRSCLTRLTAVQGKPITTIEGLEKDGRLHPLQEAFVEANALQCGYCTPGMIVEAAAFLASSRQPSEADIGRAMEGHICRCGTYPRIVQAIQKAAGRKTEGR
jgi:aerobic-type carbon monoxide dehydrogenase small subunit (CoxS/CutS family)